jgi:4-hydroxythreonine-4-phosphate dehydrogenase
MARPVLAITMGDPAGIGPEIAVKALSDASVYERSRPFVIGDRGSIADAIRIAGLPLQLATIDAPAQARFMPGTVDLLDLGSLDEAKVDLEKLVYGQVSAMCGAASVAYIERSIAMALAGDVDAVVTGPINKTSIHQAGCPYPGHTEIFAALTQTKDYAMMLLSEELRVVHVSTHVSLQEAINRTKKARILTVIRLAHRALMALGIAEPRIAVAGLNPHAGEDGLFGEEEVKEIIPAIEAAKAEGIRADGPEPSDVVFGKARGQQYDIVVCMYHDQGHIPLKTLGFNFDKDKQRWSSVAGVNVTLGLPIIRTSVDHGTAFGKAGKGLATPQSLLDSIDAAIKLARGRAAGLLLRSPMA